MRITKYEGTPKELADFFFGTLKKKVEDTPKVEDALKVADAPKIKGNEKVEECKIFPIEFNFQEDKVTALLNKVMGELKNFSDSEVCEFSFRLHTGIANLHNDRN